MACLGGSRPPPFYYEIWSRYVVASRSQSTSGALLLQEAACFCCVVFCSSYRPLSAGSIGHPTFCQTLCLFVRGGGHCPRGPGCAWCHHPSCKKKRYLDKKTRMLFRQMDDLTRITTVLPCLQAKIHELDSGTAATRALEKWRDDIMRMPQFAGHSLDAPGLEPYCVEALRRLSLTDLCGYPILPESVVACTKRLLMELMASEHTNS
ncbi:unnamed protein product [Prorocentrum cordatum]|uniref:Uncharacterized protein n=1 Tax=Prorocentrum cordatum TaxID=2364126 RepID=A0ABN9UDD1_9DINO|nr:unnamed protein product [Polarella glacialis]